MLRTRVMTAAVLIPLIVLSILLLPSQVFAVLSAVVFGCAMWEWTLLAGFKAIITRVFCLLLMPASTFFLLAMFQGFSASLHLGKWLFQECVPLLILIFWLIAAISVVFYPKLTRLWKKKPISIMAGCMVLIPAWFLLAALQYLDPALALYILSLIWVCDIGAYFVGKRFGKHQLASKLSPGKTWEGVFGAFIAGFIVIILGYRFLEFNHSLFSWIMLGLITITFSIVGDLFESLFKRLRHLKDSGSILPGHGGVLDRIDSLTAAVPIFAIGFMFFN